MKSIADFNAENTDAANPERAAASKGAGEPGEDGGPVENGRRCVMGPKLRRAGRDAMRDQEIAKSLSARSVEVAREVLRIGRGEMAQLIGVSLATALNYETGDGQIRLYQWKRVEAELIARGLLGDFERRLQRHELALAARRVG